MKSLVLLLAIVPAFALANWKSVKGDGDVVSQTRDHKDFRQVSLSIPVDTVLREGEFSVKLHLDKNLLPIVQTRVEGDRLIVEAKQGLEPNRKARVEITLPELAGIEVNGSADVEARGFRRTVPLDIDINGSGDVAYAGNPSRVTVDVNGSGDVRATFGNTLEGAAVAIQGSGDVTLGGARAAKLAIQISGSGDVNVRELPTSDGVYSVQGSGTIRTTADGEVAFEVDGSGDIHWWGNAKVKARIVEGSGEIRHHSGS